MPNNASSLFLFACGLFVVQAYSEARESRPELFLQTGHSGPILSTAYSPDGRYIATAGVDRSALLWDAATGMELRRLLGHSQMVMSVAFSPDGRQLLTGGLDGTARLWNVVTGKELRRFDCDALMAPAAIFSPDGTRVLTACYANPPDYAKGSAQLWDAATGKLLQTFKGHASYVTSVAFSPDGRRVLTGSNDATARLWDAATGSELRRFVGHAAPIRSVAFTADGRLVATGADDKTARQWDSSTGKQTAVFTAPGMLSFSALVFPDGRRAGVASMDGSAALYDIATGKRLCIVRGHKSMVSCGALSPDGRRVVTGSLDATARVWDMASGKESQRLEGRCGAVSAAAFSPDGKTILTAGGDCVARLWNAQRGNLLRQYAGGTDRMPTIRMMPGGQLAATAPTIPSVAFSPDGARMATAAGGFMTADHTVRLWDVAGGKKLLDLKGHEEGVNAVAFSPDGRRVATASDDKTARLWDASTGKELLRFKEHDASVRAAAFSPDGRRILTGGWDAKARLWDAETGKELLVFDAMNDLREGPPPDRLPMAQLVQTAAFSPDGRLALTGGTDWTVRLWDPTTGKEMRRFEAPFDARDLIDNGISSAAFSPDGRRILAAAGDGTVRVWDAATGMEMRCLGNHDGAVLSASFSPDGKRMLTAGADGTTRVWDAATGRELARLIELRKPGEWVVVTPEGYFDGSLDARRLVMWRVGDRLFPLESFEKRFHRPDLIAKALAGGSLDDKSPIPADRAPPTVSMEVEDKTADEATVKITAQAGSTAANIVGIRVTVDGRDIAPRRGAGIVRRRSPDGGVVFRAAVDFPPGKQYALVAAMVTDDAGLQSDPALLAVERPVEAPAVPRSLYVLTVGVSRYKTPQLNLNFCHADAEALAQSLKRQKGRAFADVQIKILTDEDATATNVAKGLEWLRQSCTPADVAVVLFAGHGCLTPGGLYYLTYETDFNNLDATSVNWNEMARGMKDIRARQVLFLSDCCHAGAFGQVPTPDQLAETLVKEAGVMVFASSRGDENAAERSEWGHGAFVRALLDGLDGRADLIADGQINISELQTYVVDSVGKMTENRQHPFIPRLERFDPGLILAQTR